MSIYDEAIEIIERRTKIGTMSRDYGHTVDDVLHIENAYELTTLENALERAKKVDELLELYQSWVDDTEKDLWKVICQKEKELESELK